MAKKTRLADVARAAGVSQGTASNVFNRPELVRAEVRERVEATAEQLGYSGPDPKGRLLRAGKVHAIGLVVSERLSVFARDPFDQMFMAGIADVCDERGAGLALVSAFDDQAEAAAWNVQSALVDGFIVHCLEDGARLLDLARRRNLPFVAVDVIAGPGTSSVCVDDRGGARAAAEHLIRLGHRGIGIVSLELIGDGRTGFADKERRLATRYSVSRDRLLGYEDALAEAGLTFDEIPVFETRNFKEDAKLAAAAIVERAPETTAILAMSDQTAFGVIDAARERGMAVPADLSVVGFDDITEAARSEPPLTTIAQPIVEKGRRAAELIFAGGPPRAELLAVKLVIRESTAPPRGPEKGRPSPC